MRRRRHQLQVSTFPFLAVLLCAMGSLILLLLVIDRRTKEAERDKVLNTYRQNAAEQERLVAARKAELERQSQELHARLLHANDSVLAQVHATDAELTAALHRLQDAQRAYHEAEARAASASQKLIHDRDEIGLGQARILKAAEAAEASQKDLARLAAELHELEQMVTDLKLARQRQTQTYSLMPYRGRQGDDRQPLYIECTGRGYIFHPDRLVLQLRHALVTDIRSEVQRRIARIQATAQAAAKKPYILLLVRPDGIESYYVLMRALDGLELDFGYEFVEQDWVLDFQNEDVLGHQPWMAEAAPAAPPRSDLKPLRLSKVGRANLVGIYPVPPSVGTGSGSGSSTGQGGAGTVSGNGASPGPGTGTPGALASGGTPAGSGTGGTPGQGSGGGQSTLANARGFGGGFEMTPLGPGGAGSVTNWRSSSSNGLGSGGLGGGHPAATLGAPVGAGSGGGSGLGLGNAVALAGGTGQPGASGFGAQGQGGGSGATGGSNPGSSPVGSWSGSPSGSGGNASVGIPGKTGGGVLSSTSNSVRATGPGSTNVSGATGTNGTGSGQGGTGGPGTTGSGTGGSSSTPGGLLPPIGPPGTGSSGATTSAYQVIPGSPNGPGSGNGSTTAGGPGTTSGTGTGDTGGANQANTNSAQQGGATGAPPGSSNGAPNEANGNSSSAGQAASEETGSQGGGGSGSSGGGGSGSSGGTSEASAGGGASGGGSGGAPAPAAPGAPTVSSDPSGPNEPSFGGSTGSAAAGRGEGGPPPTQFSEPLPGVAPRRSVNRSPVVQPALLNVNRDWIVGLECRGSEVIIYPGRRSFSVTALEDPAAGQALATTLRTLIEHRQASVPPGQPPYRPLLRFLVWPNGLRAYYDAYPLLEALRIPMGRVDVHSQDELHRALYAGF